MSIKAMKLALEALELLVESHGYTSYISDEEKEAEGEVIFARSSITALRQAIEQAQKQEPKCNPHPKAPHGFNRNASHANDRYTCECEGWDAYDAGYQAGVMAGIETAMGEEQKQEPVAWIKGKELSLKPPFTGHADGWEPLYKQTPQHNQIKVWGWVWKDKRLHEGCYVPSYTPAQHVERGELLALVDASDLHEPLKNTKWHTPSEAAHGIMSLQDGKEEA